MLQYLYRLQPIRTELLTQGPAEAEAAGIAAHFAYLQKLTTAGTVLLAGRTLNHDATSFGLVIFQVESPEAAEAIMNADPAVQQKIMRAELFPYQIALANVPRVG